MNRITLIEPSRHFQKDFLASAHRSPALHRPWTSPPRTPDEFDEYLKRCRQSNHAGFFLVHCESNSLVGVVNISEIVRGCFQSGYLGFYVFLPFGGQGYMSEGLRLVLQRAFRDLKLHRLEANIQPDNERSIRLVQRLGFRLEGVSPRYLKIAGRWRDHQRWAMLVEEWRPLRGARSI